MKDEIFDIEVICLASGNPDLSKCLVETFDSESIEVGYGMSDNGNCFNQPFVVKKRYAIMGKSKDEHVCTLDLTISELRVKNETMKQDIQHMETRIKNLVTENDLLKSQVKREEKMHMEVCLNYKSNLAILQKMESDLAKVREAIGTREFNKIVGESEEER